MTTLPFLPIPRFPQIGQPFAFADREDQLAEIYGAVVDAGNALIDGQPHVPARLAVTGYKGVGKSSIVLSALGLLRDPTSAVPGRGVGLSALREPKESHRWLILRVSGKHVRGIEGLPDDLHRSVLTVLQDATRDAEQAAAGVLQLSFFHRLFRTRERGQFEEVRAALTALALTVDFVRAWRGAKLSEKLDEGRRADSATEIKVFLENQLKLKGTSPESVEGKAALGLSASFIAKWSQALESKRSVEHEVTVNADLATEALNGLFAATRAARIPTIFVLDDFDELASGAGPAHAERAKVLMEVLGVFNQLAPTCLVIAIRQEYLHEDLLRQFRAVYLSPMTRAAAGEMLDAWTATQTVEWNASMRAELRAVGDLFVGGFGEDAPVVLPDSFLPLVTWAARNRRPDEAAQALLRRYLRTRYDGETVRAAESLARRLTADDIDLSAETIPIDPSPYTMRSTERLALEKSGLLRPAMAWVDTDTRIILDPLIAYLGKALA